MDGSGKVGGSCCFEALMGLGARACLLTCSLKLIWCSA